MRILRLIVAGVLCAGLCACGSAAPAEPVPPLAGHTGNYDTQAKITCGELSATATVSQESPDACTVTFTSPDSLEDMAFLFRQDSVDVSYKDLGFQFDPGSVPGGAIAKVMVSAVGKAMRDDGVTAESTEAGTELSGTLETGAFTLRLDPESGSPLKLSVPSEELEIEFVNFRFLD